MQTLLLSLSFFLISPWAGAAPPAFRTPYVTRAEALMILLQTRIPKIPALVSTGEFRDVARGSWYERYIVIADRLGIVTPNSVTHRVRPNDPVTRSEFTAMAGRTFGISATVVSSVVNDRTIARKDPRMTHDEVAEDVRMLSRLRGAAPDTAASLLLPGEDHAQRPALRQELLTLVNAERKKTGLRPLQMNASLESSAQQYARDMAEENFFGHVSPAGETLRDRMAKSGYYQPFFQSDCFCIAEYLLGENLARGQKTAAEVIADWMRSSIHRQALLNGTFTDTGIGIDAGVWVEHFGGRQK